MPVDLTFGAAIIVGLLGSSHCLGMCGGIVAALNMGIDNQLSSRPKVSKASSIVAYQLSYNVGRITSYVLVGLLAGTIGKSLLTTGISPIVGKLIAAAFMVALGLYLANWWRGLAVLERLGAKLWRHIQPFGRPLFPIRHPSQAFLLGMLWGWLPCGLVYAVLAWALSSGNPYQGAMLMLGFGLGTLPAMLVAGRVFNRVRSWARAPLLRRCAGVAIISFGLYSGYLGLAQQGDDHHHANLSTFVLPTAGALARQPAILRKLG